MTHTKLHFVVSKLRARYTLRTVSTPAAICEIHVHRVYDGWVPGAHWCYSLNYWLLFCIYRRLLGLVVKLQFNNEQHWRRVFGFSVRIFCDLIQFKSTLVYWHFLLSYGRSRWNTQRCLIKNLCPQIVAFYISPLDIYNYFHHLRVDSHISVTVDVVIFVVAAFINF